MSVIKTFERAIERMTSDRDSASATLSDVTNKIDSLKAEIAAVDVEM
jgi:prefoldin subunit 5